MSSVRPALPTPTRRRTPARLLSAALALMSVAGCATSGEPGAQMKRPALDAQAFEQALKKTTPAAPQSGATPSRRAP